MKHKFRVRSLETSIKILLSTIQYVILVLEPPTNWTVLYVWRRHTKNCAIEGSADLNQVNTLNSRSAVARRTGCLWMKALLINQADTNSCICAEFCRSHSYSLRHKMYCIVDTKPEHSMIIQYCTSKVHADRTVHFCMCNGTGQELWGLQYVLLMYNNSRYANL